MMYRESIPFVYEMSTTDACPTCRKPATGLVQRFVAPCEAHYDPEHGEVVIDGNGTDTEILWNSTVIVKLRSGEPLVQCANGHAFAIAGSRYAA